MPRVRLKTGSVWCLWQWGLPSNRVWKNRWRERGPVVEERVRERAAFFLHTHMLLWMKLHWKHLTSWTAGLRWKKWLSDVRCCFNYEWTVGVCLQTHLIHSLIIDRQDIKQPILVEKQACLYEDITSMKIAFSHFCFLKGWCLIK